MALLTGAASPAATRSTDDANVSSPTTQVTAGYPVVRSGLVALTNSRTWVLQGQRLSSGACRYRYPAGAEVIPPTGWIIRSIAIDMALCKKVFEEGVPGRFQLDDGQVVRANVAAATPTGAMALASTKGAWQRVIWRDLPGLLTTADMTQINWTYNGSTVSGGTTSTAWQFNTATKWQLTASSGTQLYGPGSSYYRGQTTATFKNSFFCAPLPTVWTYYYYNRVWGHPNGTATRSQSSDSVDECLPLHVDIESAYGQWPG